MPLLPPNEINTDVGAGAASRTQWPGRRAAPAPGVAGPNSLPFQEALTQALEFASIRWWCFADDFVACVVKRLSFFMDRVKQRPDERGGGNRQSQATRLRLSIQVPKTASSSLLSLRLRTQPPPWKSPRDCRQWRSGEEGAPA